MVDGADPGVAVPLRGRSDWPRRAGDHGEDDGGGFRDPRKGVVGDRLRPDRHEGGVRRRQDDQ